MNAETRYTLPPQRATQAEKVRRISAHLIKHHGWTASVAAMSISQWSQAKINRMYRNVLIVEGEGVPVNDQEEPQV